MLKEVTAMEARQNFGELLNEVKYRHDQVLITKAGKPIAALVDVELFEKIKKMRLQFEKLTTEVGHLYEKELITTAESEITEALQSIKDE